MVHFERIDDFRLFLFLGNNSCLETHPNILETLPDVFDISTVFRFTGLLLKKKKVPQTGCLKTTESINNSLTVQEPRSLKSRYQKD